MKAAAVIIIIICIIYIFWFRKLVSKVKFRHDGTVNPLTEPYALRGVYGCLFSALYWISIIAGIISFISLFFD